MNRKERRAESRQRRPIPPDASQVIAELFNTALQHSQSGRLNEVIRCLRKAASIGPEFAGTHYNLGNALAEQGSIVEAIACFRRAITLAPGLAEAHSNLGAALKQQGQLDEAEKCCREALRLAPDFALAHFNLGTVCEEQRRLDDAVGCYRAAIRLKPNFAEAHLNLAMVLLAQGAFIAGWPEYEWRWRTPQMLAETRDFRQPQWRGEAAEGRTLLIHAEQGYGDTLQFCRYAPLAAAHGFRVVLEVPKPLAGLLRSLAGVDRIIVAGEALPAFDVHIAMMSLPSIFDRIPAVCPYLSADVTEIAHWQNRLVEIPKQSPRIGLVWAGNARKDKPALVAVDSRRSIALPLLAPLFENTALQFFSLQKDERVAGSFPLIELMPEITDFAGTAALVAQLDLVISVDTSVAHLAGALGKPVWLLNRSDSDWRWLVGRHDSPWYPTMRIYQQPRAGDWESVIAEVKKDMENVGWVSEA